MPQCITELPNGRRRVQTVNDEKSKTIQSDVHRAEIAHIMRNYDASGVFMSLRNVDMQFRDVSEFEDYADMMLQSREAESAFMSLPSKVREVFDHDHLKWLDAAHDPNLPEQTRSKLEKLGYLKAVEAPATLPTPAREPTPPSTTSTPPGGE